MHNSFHTGCDCCYAWCNKESSWSAMGRHCFYVYYNGEQYFHELHGLSYRGESMKQKFIDLKCRTHLRKMHRKIMEALGLDRESHKISIVYRALQLLFIASDLYVTVEAVGLHAGASSQHGSRMEEPHGSLSLDIHPSFADATPLPDNTQPCSAVNDLDNIEVLEFINTDGSMDEVEVLDGTQIENNEEDSPTTVPIPKWFTLNTWDNINDPSLALGACQLTSSHKGDQPAKGMLFQNKASIHYVLTLYSVEHNKQYKVIKSDTNRLVIPKKFISEYGVDLSDMAFLTIPNGFRYEGNSEFSVLIFDATATEIDYPTAEVQVSRMEDNESDDDSLEIMDGFIPSRKNGEKLPVPCLLPHKRAKTNPSSSKLEAGDTHFRPELTTSKGSMSKKSKMVFGVSFTRGESSGLAHGVGGVAENLSTTGDVPYEDMHGDPTAVVAKDGDNEVDVDTAIATYIGPRPPSIRAMMETIMTTQATHG
nr:hypothetical protein CFP56_46914 [Quercus suber]